MSDLPETAGAKGPAARYPGVLPFADTALDRRRFFGRAEEAMAIVQQLLSAELMVVFGESGRGKSSLLNTRVFELLRDRDFLPVPVRFDAGTAKATPLQIFASAVENACKAEGVEYAAGVESSVWELFKTAAFWRGERLQTPVLVLDQFEKLFSHPDETFPQTIAAELAQLTGRRLPAHLREKLQAGQSLGFSEKPPGVKVLLCLREDALGSLQELTPEIPTILQNRVRLTGLAVNDAREAIVEPARLGAPELDFATRPFQYADDAVDEMLAGAALSDGSVDPFFLQLICAHVEKQVMKKQAATGDPITVDRSFLGGKKGNDALAASYYLGAIRRLPGARERRRARALCEEGLLTADGRRRSALRDDLQRRYKLSGRTLAQLEVERVLRKDHRHNSLYYDISHDRLAEAIHRNRRWRVPRQVKWVAAVLLTLFFVAVFLAFIFSREFEIEQRERRKAEDLISFMLFELRDKLLDARQYTLLEQIQKKVLGYFEGMNKDDQTVDTFRGLSVAHTTEGDLAMTRGNLTAALSSYQYSLGLATALATQQPENSLLQGDLFLLRTRVGSVLSRQGDLNGALASCLAGVEIFQQRPELAKAWGRFLLDSHFQIGDLRFMRAESELALTHYREAAKKSAEELLAQPEDTSAISYFASAARSTGQIHRLRGEFKEAAEALELSQRSLAEALQRAPKNVGLQYGLAATHNVLGDLRRDEGRLSEAGILYREMLAMIEKIAAPDEADFIAQRDLAPCHQRIGQVQLEEGKLEGAAESFGKMLSLMERLAAHDRANAIWQCDLASSYYDVGKVRHQQDEHADAISMFAKGAAITRALCDQYPEHSWFQHEQARGDYQTGEALAELGNLSAALGSLRLSLDRRRELVRRDQTNAEWQANLAETLWKIATVLREQGPEEHEAAATHAREALAIIQPLASEGRLKARQVGWPEAIQTLLRELEGGLPPS